MNATKQNNQSAAAIEAQYVAPQIEIIEVETAQNILGGSPVSGELPGEVGDGGGAFGE